MIRNLILVLFIFLMAKFTFAKEPLVLTPQNTVFLKDVVMDDSVTQTIKKLSELESNDEAAIYLVLDSPGGSVFAGLNLIHYLRGYKKPIHTITIFAASMGFQIVQGNPGKRYILDTGTLMSHPMSGVLKGEMGTGFSVDNQHTWLKEVIDTMDSTVVAKSAGKLTVEAYKKAYDNELWITGKNAIDAGYADELDTISCSTSLSEKSSEVNERKYMDKQFALEVKMEYSECPLMQSLFKYQVSMVDITTNVRFVMYNKGYTIESTKEDGKQAPVFGSAFEKNNTFDQLKSNRDFKTIEFYIDRDFDKLKGINWL